MLQERTSPSPIRQLREPAAAHPGPDVIVRQAQRRRLERGHKHHKPALKGSRYGPLAGGTWIRPGCKRVRPDLEGWRLVDAVEWMANRRFIEWSKADQTVLDELAVRTFSYSDLERRMVHSQASWLEGLLRDQWGDEGPGFPRTGGFVRFIADLVHARRSHAVGLWLSQPSAATLYGCTDRTFRRWVKHAESVKLIRVVQTWREDEGHTASHREWGNLLYMLGAAVIERAGPALYEGLDLQLPDGRSMKPVAQFKARVLRRERKAHLRTRHDELWQAHRITARERQTARSTHPIPSFKGPDMASRSARQSRETGGDYVPNPPQEKVILAPTSSHIETVSSPRVKQQNKVGPPGRILVAPAARRSGFGAATTDAPGPVAPVVALSDAEIGPLSGSAASDGSWRGGGSIGAMIAERMRNGFGALLLLLLAVFSGCTNSPTPLFIFFGHAPTKSASDAPNKDEYAKQHDTNNAIHRAERHCAQAGDYSKHTPDGRDRRGNVVPGARLPRRGTDRRFHGHPQRGRQATDVDHRRTSVHGPRCARRPAGPPARGDRWLLRIETRPYISRCEAGCVRHRWPTPQRCSPVSLRSF